MVPGRPKRVRIIDAAPPSRPEKTHGALEVGTIAPIVLYPGDPRDVRLSAARPGGRSVLSNARRALERPFLNKS